MAIYRPPKPRWRAAAVGVIAGLLLGVAVGFALGKPNEPNLDEAVGSIRASLARGAGSLEVAAIEYEEAVEDGEVVAEAEYEGAIAAAESAEATFASVRSALEQLAPDKVEAIGDRFEELLEAMAEKQDAGLVSRLATELEDLLKE